MHNALIPLKQVALFMERLKNSTIFFSYTKPENYSGQTAATELLLNTFSERGFHCVPIILYPPGKNSKNSFSRYFKMATQQISSLPSLLKLIFYREPILHVNLGQSYWSFIRVAIWFFPIKLINRGIKVVTSLHGNIFMLWKPSDKLSRFLLKFLNSSMIVTVLGDNQKRKLIQLGLAAQKIRVIPNSCDINVVSDSFIVEKHKCDNSVINLLHLSLLLESKGFPLYLESLEILAKKDIPRPIKAILCGPITSSPYCSRFKNGEEKRNWIEKKIELINRTSNGKLIVQWIPGASGSIKQNLFKEAHIFILPTQFPVEAQPIVLLEALSSGCGIITSTVGEILSTLNTECAVFIKEFEAQVIADEINKLISNQQDRMAMAINGAKLVRGPLSLESHIAKWEEIFNEINDYKKNSFN